MRIDIAKDPNSETSSHLNKDLDLAFTESGGRCGRSKLADGVLIYEVKLSYLARRETLDLLQAHRSKRPCLQDAFGALRNVPHTGHQKRE